MNRLHHLKETLPKNIRDNESYGDVEFIVLNYNSQDDLDNWMRKEMKSYIDKGILTYLKTSASAFWNPSHAKNMATKFATGKILCNVDSDHFTEKNYATYVNNCFEADPAQFLSGRAPGAKLDMMGRFCLWRDDFLTVRGYDESFTGYGFEDQDIYDRLKLIGRKEKSIDFSYLKTIPHHHADRVKGTMFMKDVKSILISHSSSETHALILKNNFTFEIFTLLTTKDMVSIDEQRTITGNWKAEADTLVLTSEGAVPLPLIAVETDTEYLHNNIRYRKIGDTIDALYYYSLLFNQQAYKRNIKTRQAVVNPNGFGEGVIYKNFGNETM
jgi:hypothetical protein